MFKHRLTSILTSVLLLLSAASPIWGAEPKPVLFVFDLDDTLVRYVRPPEKEAGTILPIKGDINGYRYRVLDGATDLIASVLKIPGARIAFFSGGERDRNEKLLAEMRLPDGRSAREVASAVLSREDVTHISKNSDKKDLRKLLTPDLTMDRIVLLDDNLGWVYPGQEKNALYIGKRPSSYQVSISEGTMSTERFLQDRNKLARARGLIDRVMAVSEKQGIPLDEALWQVQWIQNKKGDRQYRTELLEDLSLYRKGARELHAANSTYKFTSVVPGKSGLKNVCSDLFDLLKARPLPAR